MQTYFEAYKETVNNYLVFIKIKKEEEKREIEVQSIQFDNLFNT